ESGTWRQLLQSTGAPSIESGTTYTEFYVVKPAGYNYFQLLGGSGTFGVFYINFDIATGTIAYDSGAANVVDRGIIPLSNGWMLVYVTATATGSGSDSSAALSNNIIPDGTSARGATWDADGTSGILMCAAMHNV